jgi:hypothetical protein
MLELHENPLYSLKDRYEIAAGSAKFWKECYEQKVLQLNEANDKLAQAEEHISMTFHPDLGWAIDLNTYNELFHKYNLVTRTYTKRITGVGIV